MDALDIVHVRGRDFPVPAVARLSLCVRRPVAPPGLMGVVWLMVLGRLGLTSGLSARW